ncbi:NepR family anti-sigma factor [Methyloceanibacter caenitepidi]|uniref:NepR family anti-sigma factor n=1 Tax=Methyloceanibacter caenitepidi TaxID=1384459 RepID=UPI0005EEE9E5|nr:NepR family anti-sigma factor [Methyloceanibacter caenitepidi]
MTEDDKDKAQRRMSVDASKSTQRPDDGIVEPAQPDASMSPALQAHIGRQVRAMFDSVAEEPVPEHLLRLLKDLDDSGEK